MAAELSVIMATLNAEHEMPRCLETLMEGVTTGLVRELIVSDGGSTDATCDIADEAGAVLIKGAASRGTQLRRGVKMARGKWLLILHADTALEPGWAAVVESHIRDAGGPGYFALAFRVRGIMPALVAAWANLRSRLFDLPYGDQGLLISRHSYDLAGGYPDQPLMEDVALMRAIKEPLTPLNIRAVTSAERYVQAGWVRRGCRNLWTLARYYAGTDPKDLVAGYRR